MEKEKYDIIKELWEQIVSDEDIFRYYIDETCINSVISELKANDIEATREDIIECLDRMQDEADKKLEDEKEDEQNYQDNLQHERWESMDFI